MAMSGGMTAAALGGVADPRLGHDADDIGTGHKSDIFADVPKSEWDSSNDKDAAPRSHSIPHEDTVSFEEYHWWSKKSRAYEKTLSTKDVGLSALLKNRKFPKFFNKDSGNLNAVVDKSAEAGTPPADSDAYGVTDEEYYHAQRAVRTATWGSVFYLITTDILGPYSVPWAIAQMGYGPGAALYTVFGFLAFYSGTQLWKIFLGLDSTKYPVRNYGDVAYRVFGNEARILCNVLQSFQFFLNVALLIVTNGQGLVQMAPGVSGTGYICFVLAEVIFMLCGFVLGQIRTLARLGWLANLAVWLNVIVILMTMGVTSEYGPNEEVAASQYDYVTIGEPVMTSANFPARTDLKDHINGLMQAVFSYGGATLFNELMAEMRRPWDFWKGLICAEIFIFSVYITMGMVVYSYQGQYTFNPAYQGIPDSAYSYQTLGNAINFISGLIAALLYGNIGVKVFYAAVLRDIFHFPPLDQKKGKLIWVAFIPIYWGLAFVIAAAVPQVSYLGSFVGAACILQFSYTFPPLLMIGYNSQKDAILPEEEFDPVTRTVQRVDTGFKRFARGYKKQWLFNSMNFLYFLGALATAGLGIYASVLGMHKAFTGSHIEAFSCDPPL